MPTNLKSKTIKAVGYRFNELDDDAKERVRSCMWELEMELPFWYENVIEMFVDDLAEWGIAIDTRRVELRSGKIRHDPDVYFDVSLMKSGKWAAFGADVPSIRNTFEAIAKTDRFDDELNAEWQATGRRLLEKHGPLLDELEAAGINPSARIVDTEHYWAGHQMTVESDLEADVSWHVQTLWEDEEESAVAAATLNIVQLATAIGAVDAWAEKRIGHLDKVTDAIRASYKALRGIEGERLEGLVRAMLNDLLATVKEMADELAGMLYEEQEWLGSEEHVREWAESNDVWFTAEGVELEDFELDGGE